jgi:SanA protein
MKSFSSAISIRIRFPHNHQIIMISGSVPPQKTIVNDPIRFHRGWALVESKAGVVMVKLSRLFIVFTLVAAIFTLPRWLLNWQFSSKIAEPAEAPTGPVAIVFGAGLRRDGRPTTVLADRVETAVRLYQEGKVEKLLFSGSQHGDDYDEAQSMQAFALTLGMTEQDILLDRHGDRTYLTCLNARDTFQIDNALLISQRYHLPRALILCQTLGIEAEGVASDLHTYRAQSFWNARESIATLRALWDASKYKLDQVFNPPLTPFT